MGRRHQGRYGFYQIEINQYHKALTRIYTLWIGSLFRVMEPCVPLPRTVAQLC